MGVESCYRPPVWRLPDPVVDRRHTLAAIAGCFAGVLVPSRALAQAADSCALTPDSGEGPFYFDPELVRVDITEGVAGAPLELSVQVVRAGDCATLDGARVDLWHADAVGLYSGYDRQPGVGEPPYDARGKTFLRGTQFTDADGQVRFQTVYPSWYGGRTPHIHFKLFLGGNEVVASQLFLPDEFNNEVFEEWEPYRAHRARRRTFNENDSFLQGSVDGAFCEVEHASPGYRARALIAVAQRAG